MTAVARYILISAGLLAAALPPSRFVRRRYGDGAGRRFLSGAACSLLLQQVMVGLAVYRTRHRLTIVDALTLSRGWAAAVLVGTAASGVRDRRGGAGRLSWPSVLYGAILCDWLDGPIARHLGTSQLGSVLDLEMDSWLTLCTGAGAVAQGDLPLPAAAPPALRYPLLLVTLRSTSYREFKEEEPPWVRQIGIGQMLLYIAAMAPFRGRATTRLLHLAAPIQTLLGLGALALLHLRTWRRVG